jgi:mannose-6-phosphate isomerase-like protein (cupin superfamily)
MIIKSEYDKIKPYTTKDGSIIRELIHPTVHGNTRQSLAEATIPEGFTTLLHKHYQSEELYHIVEGSGIMFIEDKRFEVKSGDTICIPPGASHQIQNTGRIPLRLLCCCSPPYSHDDTKLL